MVKSQGLKLFDDGKELIGSFVNTGDDDDNNPAQWTLKLTQKALPPLVHDVTLAIDPYADYDFFQFRIENNSPVASVRDVEITALGGGQFDLFENGSSFTVSPDPKVNADGISYDQLKLSFGGEGLIPNSKDQNSAAGWRSDLDGSITGFEAKVLFDDGTELLGSFENIGDNDDENEDLWVLKFKEKSIPKVVRNFELAIDPYTDNSFFQFSVKNKANYVSIEEIELTVNGGGQFDLFENGAGFTISPDPGINADGISYDQLKLDFTGEGLAPGSSDENSNKGWKSDLDGTITGFDARVIFNNGEVFEGSLVNIGDNDDGHPDRWVLDFIESHTQNQTLIISDKLSLKTEIETNSDHQIAIYPNPVTRGVLFINIEALDESLGQLIISDLQGKEVVNQSINTSNLSLDLRHVPKGLYLLKIFNDSKTHTRKIILR